ncbi:MAG: metallophosphoesterase [Nitrososphaeraceae archaeon]
MANTPFVVVYSADSDHSERDDANPDSVFKKIVKEKPDRYIFGGDGPYAKEGKTWTKLINEYGLKPIIKLAQGNHDCDESESEQTEKDIEAGFPELELTKTPEVDTSEEAEEWEKTKWIYSWQDRNAFFIVMNTQDNDIVFKRNQYNWVVKQLEFVKDLKAQGTVDWIFAIVHKPWYTLKTKSGHWPLTEMRRIFQPLFDEAEVDFVLSGHNHNFQAWLPMIHEATPKFTKNSDGTYDFSKPHGQFYIVNGAGGHEINKFKEEWKKNKKVIFADRSDFCYTVFKIDGKNCDVLTKDTEGNILFSIKVTK